MPNVLTIREAVQRARGDGMKISEYALRQWVRIGAIPTRKVGQKVLLFYPNLIKYLQCEDGCDNAHPTVAVTNGIRRVNL